ncbi:MAG TPA: hypothetical protein VHC70_13730 [Phycisphaerales bacterium]|nr:hypothetical protein [Phycisphaerales bacterium]
MLMSKLGQAAKKAAKRAEILALLEEAITSDREFGRVVYEALDEEYGGNGHAPRKRIGRPNLDGKRLAKIVEVLAGKDWMGTPSLAKAAGMLKVQAKEVMRAHPEQFEVRNDPENAKRLQWRIKGT